MRERVSDGSVPTASMSTGRVRGAWTWHPAGGDIPLRLSVEEKNPSKVVPKDMNRGIIIVCVCASIATSSVANLMAGEPAWVKVTEHTAFQARDSAGEVVYDGKMWLLGGWFNSLGPFPNDVWSSRDGVNWTCVTASAPWLHGDLPTTMVFDNKMWFMGGWYDGRNPGASASNEVWCSTNGAAWTKVSAVAPWAARCGAAGAVLHGKMWILGGTKEYYYGNDGSLLNDVWSSRDGIHWEAATQCAPWSPRAFHQVLAFDNKLWVLGGGNYVPNYRSCNDVWNSSDGVHWTKVTEHAPWKPRLWHTATVYDHRMWILGGWSNHPSQNHNDVWHSTDGLHWTPLETDATWSPRHEHSTYVYQDKLWVVGGNPWPCTNDVWQINATTPEASP